MKTVVLFQPRYPYARRKVYLPGGLMNLGSRLMEAGVKVAFFDLNLIDLDSKSVKLTLKTADMVGFSVIGPPYIPVVRDDIQRLREYGYNAPILVGGEGIVRVRHEDFARWFSGLGHVVQITEDADITAHLHLPAIHSTYDASMVPMLEYLDDTLRFQYLSREFALFFSQGCKFGCKFCAAAKVQRETHRTTRSLAEEVDYVCRFLAAKGHRTLSVYLTNLDALQNPNELEERLRTVWEIARRFGVTVHARALATSRCTVQAVRADGTLLRRLSAYGLRTVGFGADGADEETWRRQNKAHNTLSELAEATARMQEADITVETLMVLGFPGDTLFSLSHSFTFAVRSVMNRCMLRPYLAKPSPSGMWEGECPTVNAFLRDPSLLTRLDYAALGSKETHPVRKERWIANATYLALCLFALVGRCCTYPLVPVPKRGIGRWVAQTINRLMPFDK